MYAYHMFLDASFIIVVLFSFSSSRPSPARLPSSGIIFSLFMSRPNETARSIPMLTEYTHGCVGSQPGPVSHQAADELVESHLEHLVTHALAALVLDGREGVLDDCFFLAGNPKVSSAQFNSHHTPSNPPPPNPPPSSVSPRKENTQTDRLTVFDPEVDVDLVQDVAHAEGGGLSQQGEAEVGRGLVVVELILAVR